MNKDYKKVLDVLEERLEMRVREGWNSDTRKICSRVLALLRDLKDKYINKDMLQTVWIETSKRLPEPSDKCIAYRLDCSGNDEYKLVFLSEGFSGEYWVDTDAYMYNKDYFSHWATITKPQGNKKNEGGKQIMSTIQYYRELLKKVEDVLIDWTKESSNETERLSFLKVFDYIQEIKNQKKIIKREVV